MATTSTPSAHHDLNTQVGGHPGVQSSEDGSLIIKPCLPAERDFYQLISGGDERFSHLKEWVPRFYGTLKLEGKVKEGEEASSVIGSAAAAVGGGGKRTAEEVVVSVQRTLEAAPAEAEKDMYFPSTQRAQFISLVLENVSASFVKPCILDIKLGTVLYDEGASEEKKARMIKAAADTTSLESGVRLTGFMVHDHTTKQPAVTPKAYGKSIKVADLPDGMVRFFPLASTSEDGSPSGQGLPRDLLIPVIEGLLADVRAIREAMAQTELRMVGGSILVVYEADWEKARLGLEKLKNESGRMEDDEEDDEEDEDEDGIGPPYVIRMIDFAHTRFVPRQGPDEGVLLGLDTTIRLFEGRIKQLKEA